MTWAELYVAFTMATRMYFTNPAKGDGANQLHNQILSFSNATNTLRRIVGKPLWPGTKGTVQSLSTFGCRMQLGLRTRPRFPNHEQVETAIAQHLADRLTEGFNLRTRCWKWSGQFPVLRGGSQWNGHVRDFAGCRVTGLVRCRSKGPARYLKQRPTVTLEQVEPEEQEV